MNMNNTATRRIAPGIYETPEGIRIEQNEETREWMVLAPVTMTWGNESWVNYEYLEGFVTKREALASL